MTESEWLTCADPVAMLDYLSRMGNRHECATERKLWLFVCAVQRAWWGEAPRRDLASITTLERMADADNVTRPGLENVHFTYTVPPDARDAALECVRVHNSRGDSKKWAAIIRDIVGNPFRPVELSLCEGCYGREDHGPSGNANWKRSECPCCGGVGRIAPWLTPAVLSLAQAAYDIRCRGCNQCYDGWLPGECIRLCPNVTDGTLDPARLAVLADALEEAGCDNSGGVCPECNGSGELGTLGGKIGCYVCASDYKTRGTGRSNRRLLRCQCGGNYGIVKKDLFPAPLSSCQKCWADGPSWADVIRGEVLPHPILAHLRSPGPHWRGCWAVDLILGKE